MGGGGRRLGKITKNLEIVAKTVAKPKKCQNIYTKAQFESPKHLHQITFEPLKRSQQTMLCENVKKVCTKK